MATFSAAQTASGSSLGWYHGPLDANGCPVPDAKEVYACIYTSGAIKISSLGAPYADPTNMIQNTGFSLTVDPVAIGAVGSLPTLVNLGTAQNPELKLTLPPAAQPVKWTTLNCDSITGVVGMSGGIITITKATGVNCTQQ